MNERQAGAGAEALAVPELERSVSARVDGPTDPWGALVLGHGAGAGMDHRFMTAMRDRFVDRGLAVVRYQFPYMDAGRRRPDRAPVLEATVVAAVRFAVSHFDCPLFAGGKSMGGRMTTRCAAEGRLEGLRGLVLLGFPLHPAGRPGSERARHLKEVPQPMLFLQGTRDRLAHLDLLEPVCRGLGERATLHVVEGGDHSFEVLKRSGRTREEALDELADVAVSWMDRRLA